MPRVIFFTIHSTTPWWKYLASRMEFADAVVLSDLRNDGDYSLVDDFYRFIDMGDAAAVAIARFGEEGCADIILRCRVLRSIDRDLAGEEAVVFDRGFHVHAADEHLPEVRAILSRTGNRNLVTLLLMEMGRERCRTAA